MNIVERRLAQGCSPSEIEPAILKAMHTTSVLAERDGQPFESHFSTTDIIMPDGTLNLECQLTDCNYGDTHPLRGMIEWRSRYEGVSSCLYVVLVVEGHVELLSWGIDQAMSRWEDDKHFDAVRMAAYLGQTDIVHMLVQKQSSHQENSLTASDSLRPAILGAAEALDVANLALYMNESEYTEIGLLSDPLMEGFERTLGLDRLFCPPREVEEDRRKRQNLVCTSIVASAVYACLHEC